MDGIGDGGYALVREPVVNMGDWRKPRGGLTKKTGARNSRGDYGELLRRLWELGIKGAGKGHLPVRDMRTKFALWSSDYTRITGQALVTARVVRHQPGVSWREYVYRGAGWRSAISWIAAVLCLWCDIALGRIKSLYLVCSRSNGGFLRDLPALLAACAGVRTVVHAHGSDIVDLLSSRALSPLARALYARCEIVVPSTHLLEPLCALTSASVHVCENYSAGGFQDTMDDSAYSVFDAFTVLWNSNVMASKGFFDLAEAMLQLHQEGLSVRLVSVGQALGDEEMSAQDAAGRLDALLIQEWLDYRGKVEPQTVAALVSGAHVVCLPSRYSSECQPLAIIQAMCAGKSILVSDIPALQATLRDYPARFVPTGSAGAIADTLRELYRQQQADPAAFASSRAEATRRARARFSTARFDREMAAILQGEATIY